MAYGDWSVKVGHFFTIIGYEVVPDTGNFFYSHSYTMFNSEPFTHTGVLGTYTASDATTVYAGWTLGWDTGFDQFDGGSNWLGGISHTFGDNVTVTYASTAGNFGSAAPAGSGYSQSVVAVADVSYKLQYVFQTDWVTTNGFYDDPTLRRRRLRHQPVLVLHHERLLEVRRTHGMVEVEHGDRREHLVLRAHRRRELQAARQRRDSA